MNKVEIRKISCLPQQVLILKEEADAEGFRFLARLVEEWESGTNRFDGKGECLMAAFLDGCLVGIGGLSRDPFIEGEVGRLRRLYVSSASRGQNIGTTLVNHLVEHAAECFSVVRLFTDTSSAAGFYLRCGFQPVNDRHASHVRVLEDA
ncbi:GNAT family N-acetyltransferase [Pseudomonas tremae]|uniref:GNAT family N-acetyltransferase n=1 Tax=Pseudomonas tremae TaxID=200454 RepID=A0ABV4PD13_9PSED|nr:MULTISPECIES: GNAT family N-acetyltransferase [Pseudomonas syringae group]KGS14118.1 acetyltransferase [Pseudomonas coronafaciens]KPW35431.1 GNAT family acetyltransferase [Pseudomonas coronafaciens pv. atropurpurea]MCF5802550.1 GNAT family N-acetyltransferase [Pseudomonas tremae]MCF5808519.1 GNAT family N-acetyltransferase [Pseudomonas tremae]MCQ3016320.1 GNAT family N-acetyltransferase [Pseudomonas tremae]